MSAELFLLCITIFVPLISGAIGLYFGGSL